MSFEITNGTRWRPALRDRLSVVAAGRRSRTICFSNRLCGTREQVMNITKKRSYLIGIKESRKAKRIKT